MLITPKEFAHAANNLSQMQTGHIGVDFETDGLSVYRGARAFILGFTCTEGNKFSIRMCPEIQEALRLFFSNPRLKYCAHNAKFEASFIKHQFGIEPPTFWDTEVFARVEYNNHMGYSLQKCAERIQMSKYPPMLEWLAKNKRKGLLHKDAPAELIEPYVEQDAYLSWVLATRQMNQFRHWDTTSLVPVREVVRLEMRTFPHLLKMEENGLLVDVNYCRRAVEYERNQIEEAKKEFQKLTSVPFVDSRKTLQPVFDSHGIRYGKTELGNASFTEECLEGDQAHPIVAALLKYRGATKRASSYWDNFLELEQNGIIHPSINQNRAATGRMSISDPSCQNWPTDETESPFPVRRAFVARTGCQILSIDYSQMELRLMADEAGDHGIIEALASGFDFHQATADSAGVPRSLAKNGRFAKLYGAGPKKVAETLGVTYAVSKKICDAIDDSSPRITAYTYELIKHVERAKFGHNFLGRRYFFDSQWYYTYPNYRIQGGCSEILRQAICDVGDFLREKASKETFMLIVIHDEILFNIAPQDLKLIPEIKRLMIAAHRSKKYLEMGVEAYLGPNFFDVEKMT